MKNLDLKKGIMMVLGLSTGIGSAFAQVPGEVDTDWGMSGWISTDHVTNKGEIFHDMITLENDGFLMIGQTATPDSDMLLAKYNSDGTLNEDFGNGGVSGVSKIDLSLGGNDIAFSAEILFDGKILVIGSTTTLNGVDIALIRLEENGGLDSSFGTNGVVRYSAGNNTWSFANKIKVLPDNSIIVGAYTLSNNDYNISLLKFTQGGGLDLNFGDNGVFTYNSPGTDDEITGMEVSGAGDIYISWIGDDGANQAAIIMKLDNTGTIDATFNAVGAILYNESAENFFTDLKLDANGKIVVVGHEGSGDDFDGLIIRYNTDGTIDESFGTNGKITMNIGAANGILFNNLEIIQGGKMLASGNASGQTLDQVYGFIFDETGSSDCSFSSCGGMYLDYTFAPVEYKGDLLTLLSDGSILLGGHATSQDFIGEQMYVVKVFNTNQVAGLNENNFDKKNISIYPNPTHSNFNIEVNDGEEIKEVQLIGFDGRKVQFWTGSSAEYLLNNNISAGSYLVKVLTNETVYTNNLTVR